MHYQKLVLSLLTLFLLSGCSCIKNNKYIQNRDRDYLCAQSIPPLRIPCGLSNSTIQTKYPIPDRCYTDCQKQVDLTPPGLYQ